MKAGLEWFNIQCYPSHTDVLPWFWRADQRLFAAYWNELGRPFVSGPNMVFENSTRPRSSPEECAVLDAVHCRAMFCNSEWYRDLIAVHRGAANCSPIVLWPAPIDPWPTGPRRPHLDLLIYAKNGYDRALIGRLRETFSRSVVVAYGSYDRSDLLDAASHALACAYLADNDHGPLALQEILLAGCPTVGVPTGTPFVEPGITGFLVRHLPSGRDPKDRTLAAYVDYLRRAQSLDRSVVRDAAAVRFSTARIVNTVLEALEQARLAEPKLCDQR